jgi:hypothetical protein
MPKLYDFDKVSKVNAKMWSYLWNSSTIPLFSASDGWERRSPSTRVPGVSFLSALQAKIVRGCPLGRDGGRRDYLFATTSCSPSTTAPLGAVASSGAKCYLCAFVDKWEDYVVVGRLDRGDAAVNCTGGAHAYPP